MKNSIFKSRAFAMLLTLMMTLSLSIGAFTEAFATENEGGITNEETAAGEEAAAEDATAEEAEQAEADALPEAVEKDGGAKAEAAGSAKALAAAAVGTITLRVTKNPAGSIDLRWDAVEGAKYYKIGDQGHPELSEQTVNASSELKCSFTELSSETPYVFEIKAYGENDALLAEGSQSVTTYGILFDESKFRVLSGDWGVNAVNLGLSLRTMLGAGHNDYAVAQGAATDGTYAYYMMASSGNQKGRVLKLRLSDNAVVGQGPVLDIHHANGMTYDSKRQQLVCVGYGSWRQQLSFIDPDSLTLVKQQNVSYPNKFKFDRGVSDAAYENGLAAIAYVEKYNVYVCRSRGRNNGVGDSDANNNIWVFNADTLEAIGHVYVKITGKYPETYQSMDADEKYVYYLLSPGSGQSRNIILALDWNSENILPVVNGEEEYVENMWYANNNGSGEPDAVRSIPISHESEGLFHTTDANGNAHFYVSEYHGRWVYKTVTKKKKYKVKWKKVKKKVKWKKVKRHGKWKWKYKKKKVWKYKTKTKKVKVKEKDYWARDDYVYYLGVI